MSSGFWKVVNLSKIDEFLRFFDGDYVVRDVRGCVTGFKDGVDPHSVPMHTGFLVCPRYPTVRFDGHEIVSTGQHGLLIAMVLSVHTNSKRSYAYNNTVIDVTDKVMGLPADATNGGYFDKKVIFDESLPEDYRSRYLSIYGTDRLNKDLRLFTKNTEAEAGPLRDTFDTKLDALLNVQKPGTLCETSISKLISRRTEWDRANAIKDLLRHYCATLVDKVQGWFGTLDSDAHAHVLGTVQTALYELICMQRIFNSHNTAALNEAFRDHDAKKGFVAAVPPAPLQQTPVSSGPVPAQPEQQPTRAADVSASSVFSSLMASNEKASARKAAAKIADVCMQYVKTEGAGGEATRETVTNELEKTILRILHLPVDTENNYQSPVGTDFKGAFLGSVRDKQAKKKKRSRKRRRSKDSGTDSACEAPQTDGGGGGGGGGGDGLVRLPRGPKKHKPSSKSSVGTTLMDHFDTFNPGKFLYYCDSKVPLAASDHAWDLSLMIEWGDIVGLSQDYMNRGASYNLRLPFLETILESRAAMLQPSYESRLAVSVFGGGGGDDDDHHQKEHGGPDVTEENVTPDRANSSFTYTLGEAAAMDAVTLNKRMIAMKARSAETGISAKRDAELEHYKTLLYKTSQFFMQVAPSFAEEIKKILTEKQRSEYDACRSEGARIEILARRYMEQKKYKHYLGAFTGAPRVPKGTVKKERRKTKPRKAKTVTPKPRAKAKRTPAKRTRKKPRAPRKKKNNKAVTAEQGQQGPQAPFFVSDLGSIPVIPLENILHTDRHHRQAGNVGEPIPPFVQAIHVGDYLDVQPFECGGGDVGTGILDTDMWKDLGIKDEIEKQQQHECGGGWNAPAEKPSVDESVLQKLDEELSEDGMDFMSMLFNNDNGGGGGNGNNNNTAATPTDEIIGIDDLAGAFENMPMLP